jgi:hypothetical protein
MALADSPQQVPLIEVTFYSFTTPQSAAISVCCTMEDGATKSRPIRMFI